MKWEITEEQQAKIKKYLEESGLPPGFESDYVKAYRDSLLKDPTVLEEYLNSLGLEENEDYQKLKQIFQEKYEKI